MASSANNYGPWAQIRLWRQRLKAYYPYIFWLGLAFAGALVFAAVWLNQNGYRLYNLWIGLALGLVPAYFLLKPTILEWVAVAGVAKNVADGKAEPLTKELEGALTLLGGYTRLVGYMFIVIQTVFMAMAIKRFEDPDQAYVTVLAILVFTLTLWVMKIKGH